MGEAKKECFKLSFGITEVYSKTTEGTHCLIPSTYSTMRCDDSVIRKLYMLQHQLLHLRTM
jgi:hypothetical protein